MNKNKLLALIMASVMMVMGFAGCSGNDSNSRYNHKNDYDYEPGHTTIPHADNVETDFTVTVGTISGKPGETVDVPIEITNSPGVCAFYIAMTYDEKLDLVGHKDGGVLSDPLHGGDMDANPYNLTWDDALELNKNVGVITTLEFVISKDAKAGEILEVSVQPMFGGEGAILDYDLNDVPINCVAGGVEIKD